MEISGIDRVQSAKPVSAQKGIQQAEKCDTVAISPDAKKKEAWVEMLKEMDDIRPKKIEASRESPSLTTLAQKIQSSPI